jgi:nitrous oxidase accessory protein NosD
MKRRGAVLLLAVVAAVGLAAIPAGATGSRGAHARVLVVDEDARHHKSCYGKHRRVFRTIQSAVDAADPGDTIKVCPGLYQETVKVAEPDLRILGANAGRDATGHYRGPESIVEGTPGTPVPGVVQLLADDITWDGFTIRGVFAKQNSPGMYTSPAHSGYLIRDTIFFDNGNGIHLGASGTHPTLVCRNRFTANNEFAGPTGGFGIYSDQRAQQVLITSNRFERHNAAAIFFADPKAGQRDVLIEHNKSVDDMTFASIFNSTRVRVTSNWIRARVGDDKFPGPASAIFIGAGNDDIVVQKNKVRSASGSGIHITDTSAAGTASTPPSNVIVRRNKVEHAEEFGLEVSASGAREYQLLGNRSRANKVGIHLGDRASGVVVRANTALDNTKFDCQDESNPLANTWRENAGATSSPPNAGLCTAPSGMGQASYDNDRHGKDHDKQKFKKHKKHHKQTKKSKHRPDPCVCSLPWRH